MFLSERYLHVPFKEIKKSLDLLRSKLCVQDKGKNFKVLRKETYRQGLKFQVSGLNTLLLLLLLLLL